MTTGLRGLPHDRSPEGGDQGTFLTVALPVFNGAATIAATLASLAAQDTNDDWDLLVVDNGSTDSTRQVVESFASRLPNLRLESAPERQNLSYVRNRAVELTRTSAVAFVDADDTVATDWVRAMLAALKEHPWVASRLDYGELNSAASRIGRGDFQSRGLEKMWGYPVVAGAGFGVQRWVWEQVGGNDETFSTTGEDFDFAMRVNSELALSPRFAAEACYHYRLRDAPGSSFRQFRKYGQSHAQLYARHGQGRLLLSQRLKPAAREWWWLVSRIPLLLASSRRTNWTRRAGRRLGRLEGCAKYRVLLP